MIGCGVTTAGQFFFNKLGHWRQMKHYLNYVTRFILHVGDQKPKRAWVRGEQLPKLRIVWLWVNVV